MEEVPTITRKGGGGSIYAPSKLLANKSITKEYIYGVPVFIIQVYIWDFTNPSTIRLVQISNGRPQSARAKNPRQCGP